MMATRTWSKKYYFPLLFNNFDITSSHSERKVCINIPAAMCRCAFPWEKSSSNLGDFNQENSGKWSSVTMTIIVMKDRNKRLFHNNLNSETFGIVMG